MDCFHTPLKTIDVNAFENKVDDVVNNFNIAIIVKLEPTVTVIILHSSISYYKS